MLAFAALLQSLILTPSRSAKLRLLARYFRDAPDPSRGWALAALAGQLDLPSVKPAAIRELVAGRVDPVLFALSYDYVGDLAETASLVWPATPGANRTPTLDEVVETLRTSTRSEGLSHLERWLDALDPPGRWALLKLVTRGFRIGVSGRLARQAAADAGGVDVAEVEEIWHGLTPPYASLFAWLDGRTPRPSPSLAAPFRPVMLAHPLVDKPGRLADAMEAADDVTPEIYAAEWKWDGVRVQAVNEGGARRLFTRTGEDVSAAFPDVIAGMTFDGALDGELLIRTREGGVAQFNDLQRRLNRKTASPRDVADRPAFVRAYDILTHAGQDLRPLAFSERRRRLERVIATLASPVFDLSPLLPFDTSADLDALRRRPPVDEIEGVMLKRWDAAYTAGRPAGLWWKWKRDPFSVDAVLMYAQRGHGRRATFFSDFTFGVWRGPPEQAELTPVGKAYSGFTDEELKRLDRHVRENTTERFGPVRAVRADQDSGLVLEIAFDGVQRSARHRSGLAMRFPRIQRIRWDKPANEADTIDALERLLPPPAGGPRAPS